MEMHHKKNNNFILKTLFILSFFLVCSINQDGQPMFILLLIYFIEFFNSFTYKNFGINWIAVLLPIITMGTLIIFSSYEKYKNGYLMILCFISLLMVIVSETGVLNSNNYKIISYEFIIPLVLFIFSSVSLIIKVFNNKI